LSFDLKRIIDAAQGRIPSSLIVENARVLNVFTGEVIGGQSIAIYNETILGVGRRYSQFTSFRRINAQNQIAIPGLVDTHLHIESTMMVPWRFAESVLPHGTTTVFADPHEIVNVFGKEGLRMMLDNSKQLPMKIYYFAPPCVPESSAVTSGANIGPKDVKEMLGWDGVKGLAEVMDYPALLSNRPKIRSIIAEAKKKGAIIDGHAPLLSGPELAAYIASGAEADHENFDPASTVEKLRNGMYVKLRGPDILDPELFVTSFGRLPSPRNIIFVTDDVMPDRLAQFGHLDRVCRAFIESGMDPVEAVRSVTLHPAQHVRMPELGAIAPGKSADIVLMKDLKRFVPSVVISRGKIVARNGRMTGKIRHKSFDATSRASLHVGSLLESDFRVKAPVASGSVRVNCIEFTRGGAISSEFLQIVLTKLGTFVARVSGGIVDEPQLAIAFVIERHRNTGRRSFAFVHGLMQDGAFATTVSHDAHNLVVVGKNAKDMVSASRAVAASHGGLAAVKRGKLLAQIELPIAGLMSEAPLKKLAGEMKKMRSAFRQLGMIDHPYMPIPFLLTLSVIPHARITDRGLFDVDRQIVLPHFAD
jgi:adenine deaminase